MEQKLVVKPWGRERILEVNDRYAMKILEVDAGHRLSLQYHVKKVETMYCLYGYGTLFVDNREMDLLPGRYITIEPGQIHRLQAGKNSPIAILETSSPELDDLVRLDDDYKR